MNHKVFPNYMESWEKVKVNKKHEMFKLLEKYKRMFFFDKDEKNEDCDGLFMILSRNLEWFKRGRAPRLAGGSWLCRCHSSMTMVRSQPVMKVQLRLMQSTASFTR